MKFILPLRFHKSKNKMLSLSLNVFRTAHYQTLNKGKKEIKAIIKDKYGYGIKQYKAPVMLVYEIFFPDNRDADLGNFGCGVGKFTEDALVELNYLEDDNRKIVKEIRYRDGGIDRQNPRAELSVIELEKWEYGLDILN